MLSISVDLKTIGHLYIVTGTELTALSCPAAAHSAGHGRREEAAADPAGQAD